MAKNPGHGNKIFRRNDVPDLTGQTITNAQNTLTSLGFTSTVTTENTTNSSLGDTVKSQDIVGTAQIGQNINLVKYIYVAPFGFSPFGAFGFTPFGFTPFGAFGFTPWGFGFGNCIGEDTLIETPDGQKAAKDIRVGDMLTTISINEIPLQGVNSSDYDWKTIAIESLTSTGITETQVTAITPKQVNEVVWFNNNETKKYSLTQPMFIKGDPYYVKIGRAHV